MGPEEVYATVTLDRAWLAEARSAWLTLMELAVFGDVKSSRLGVTTRLRKRALEVGERLRSLGADRAWIPHPREQLKNALASALALRESLAQLEAQAREVDGGEEAQALASAIRRLAGLVEALQPLENRWALTLEALNRELGNED
jgi:hypothetical protein